MPLQIRRGTNAQRQAMTQALAQGELLYVTDDQRLYIGNGSTLGGVQITGYTDEDAQDAAALLFSNGTHTGITFTYNDAANSLSALVDLTNYQGTIGATSFKGSVFADDSTILVDAVDGVLRGSLIGSVTGNVTGNVVGNVTGNLLGNVTGTLDGDVTGSIFADDSTILVDAVDKSFFGNLTGIVTGNVTGNLTGNLLNSIGNTVVDVSTKTATLAQLNIETAGSISSPSLLINTPEVSFITGTVSLTQPFVNVFVASSAGAATSPVGLVRSRGTLISPATVTTNDEIGRIVSSAFDGTTFILAADMTSIVDGTVSTGVVPSRIDFSATNSTGFRAVKMSIKASAVEFTAPPRLPVIVDDTARTAAVPTPTKGMMIMMETGTTPAGTNVAQVFDGSAWVNLY